MEPGSGGTDYGGSDATNCNATGITIVTGQWQMIAFTFDSSGFGTRTSFLNGAKIGSYTPSSGVPNITSGTFSIGRWRNPWNGNIDDVRLYSSTLSSSDIQKIYAEEKASHEVADKYNSE